MSKQHQPPIWADRLLEWYCDPLLVEDLQGDLYERFMENSKKHSPLRAKLNYVLDVIKFIKPYTLKRNRNSMNPSLFFMLPNYIKSSTRSLLKDKLNTSVSIIGLALGLAVFCLISVYVKDELKYDTQLENANDIYRITTSYASATSTEHAAWAPTEVSDWLLEYEFIAATTSLVNEPVTVKVKENVHREVSFYFADPNYFKVFPYPVKKGSVKQFAPGEIAITENTSTKYFGDGDALNQTIDIGNKSFTVVAILYDLPTHTDLKFDALMSTEDVSSVSGWTFSFARLKPGTSEKQLAVALHEIFNETTYGEFEGSVTEGQYHMEPLTNVHFSDQKLFDTPKSSRANLYLFSSIAIIILTVAGLNYMNLSLASSSKKQVEVGIRKAIGAQIDQLRAQYLIKSFLVCATALILSFGLVVYCLPMLNSITNKSIEIQEFFTFQGIAFLTGGLLLLTIIAGGYPAFILAASKTVIALKGNRDTGSKSLLQNSVITVQFVISIVLIMVSLIVSRQMDLVMNESHGMTEEPVMLIDIPDARITGKAVHQFKNELNSYPFIKAAGFAGFNSWPTTDMDIDIFEVKYQGEWKVKPFNNIEVDSGYFAALDLEFLQGRNFTPQETDGTFQSVIVNQALVDNLGWKDPLNETINYETGLESIVVGVIENFHFNTLKSDFEPIIIYPADRFPAKLLVRLNSDYSWNMIEDIETAWKKTVKGQPFYFDFLQTSIQNQYKSDMTMRTTLNVFVIVAIILSALGLFGLIALTTGQRLKEISIRKTLGAGGLHLWAILSRRYVQLIFLAFIIATPLSIFSINLWMQSFTQRVSLSIDVFIIAIALAFITAFLAMSVHIIRAIAINPVKILNNE